MTFTPFMGQLTVLRLGSRIAALAVSLFVLSMPVQADDGTSVDLELILAVDISGSVDDDEAILQRDGYIQAFRDPQVIEAIQSGFKGAIAVTYMEWAGSHHQQVLVDWSRIDDADSAGAFADALSLIPTRVDFFTSISAMIDAAITQFARSPFEGTRRVLDISGDGANNQGDFVTNARDRALALGFTINGLPIVNDRPSRYGRLQIPNLDLYYIDCVVGGSRSFIIVANGFEDYARAVRRKLILEIADALPAAEPERLLHQAKGRVRPPCTVGEQRRRNLEDEY
jgi:hypothetical protein